MNTLSRGSKGTEVKYLQTALNWAGCNISVDGDFGPATYNAVITFQGNFGLVADGVAGPKTWTKLKEVIAYYATVGRAALGCMAAIETMPQFRELQELM